MSKCKLCNIRRANYGFKGEPPVLCYKDRISGMVNRRKYRKYCEECFTRPSYCLRDNRKKQYCKNHMNRTTMVPLHMCIIENCFRPAYYNSKRTHCSIHQDNTMKNTKISICKYTGCTNGSCFGFTKREFCSKHRTSQMRPFKWLICITCKKSSANYGIPGQQKLHCAKDKQSGDILNPQRKCIVCLNVPAIFGIGNNPEFCADHKSDIHINLVQKPCTVCNLLEIVDNEQKCSNCSTYLKTRLHLRKQRLVKQWLDDDPLLKTYKSYDKIISSCSKERPDFVYDAGTHNVIVEVDETQHENYHCESTRMINITYANSMQTIWIRYNPDGKFNENIKKQVLMECLRECLQEAPKEFCSVIYLFYDRVKRSEVKKLEII